ncbi:MAG: cation:proton antiporter [Thermodesulfobacteriota bacterium]
MFIGDTFVEIAAILGLATLLAFIGQKLRQPLIIMFLATGIIAGPFVLGIIESYDKIELLAEIGIALLLFIVGLKLDLNLIRTTGPVALATGLGQIFFTSAVGFLIAMAFGMTFIHAAYVAVALTFSSTIIIVKLLSDKNEIDSLHGQIAIGFLIVQDIAAIAALVVLTTFGAGIEEEETVFLTSVLILVKGVAFLAAIGFLMKYVLPWLTHRLAQSQELLTLFAIAWSVFLGATGEVLGFSKEVGAFLAGISLASTDYRDAIGVRLYTLRDFLLLFFFIHLGARLDWATVGTQLGSSAVFSLFVLVGNPIIVLVIMGLMGYRRRTGFKAGLTVAQISEFSLIVAAMGLSIGHITDEIMGLITLVGVVTIFASTYLILYSDPLYTVLSKPLKLFERNNPYRESTIESGSAPLTVDAIILGLGNYGSGLADYMLQRRKTIIGVDFDPGALHRWREKGVTVIYGDMSDPEIHDQLPLKRTRWVVSTVRSKELNISLMQHLDSLEYDGKIALTAQNQAEADLFKSYGAQVVFRPFIDAAEQAADALTHAMDVLPDNFGWPISFREVRIRTGSVFAGARVKKIPLRPQMGVSILAISRAGHVHFDPGPDFRVYPGDRLVITGPEDELKRAESLLNEIEKKEEKDADRFAVVEIRVGKASENIGKSLEELQFRQNYGVTVVGIRRGDKQIQSPGSAERLVENDRLMVIGSTGAIDTLKAQGEL